MKIESQGLKRTASSVLRRMQKAAIILMGGTLLLHGLRFVKSLLMAGYYGTSADLDAYFLSLAPYSLISGILISAIQVTIIPKYLELRVKDGDKQAVAVLFTVGVWMMLGVVIIGLGFWGGGSFIASLLGRGFTESQLTLTTSLLKMSSLLLILSLVNEVGLCLFYAHRHFVFCAFIPMLGGLLSLGYLLVFFKQGVSALLVGLIFGMGAQASVVWYAARRVLPASPSLTSPWHPEVRQTFKAIFPLLLGASFGHVNLLVDQAMAATLPEGSISALNYAAKLHQLSTQLFVVVVLQAVFPFLAQQVAERDWTAVHNTFSLTAQKMLALLIPISLGIICCGTLFVRLIFQRGEFTTYSTAATSGAWIAYTLCLPVQGVRHLIVRMYNAMQENLFLMYVAAISIGLNIFFNVIFMKFWGHIGIALSTSGVHIVTAGVLFYFLRRKIFTSHDNEQH